MADASASSAASSGLCWASRTAARARCARLVLEVAELVVARKTNREIAAELFLSEKTVETHLRNIFGKLGLSSRRTVAHALEGIRARAG